MSTRRSKQERRRGPSGAKCPSMGGVRSNVRTSTSTRDRQEQNDEFQERLTRQLLKNLYFDDDEIEEEIRRRRSSAVVSKPELVVHVPPPIESHGQINECDFVDEYCDELVTISSPLQFCNITEVPQCCDQRVTCSEVQISEPIVLPSATSLNSVTSGDSTTSEHFSGLNEATTLVNALGHSISSKDNELGADPTPGERNSFERLLPCSDSVLYNSQSICLLSYSVYQAFQLAFYYIVTRYMKWSQINTLLQHLSLLCDSSGRCGRCGLNTFGSIGFNGPGLTLNSAMGAYVPVSASD